MQTTTIATDIDNEENYGLFSIAKSKAMFLINDRLVELADKTVDTLSSGFSNDKSPLRNLSNVASDPVSTPLVVKNYIKYQKSRSAKDSIWKQDGFIESLLKAIDELKELKNKVIDDIQNHLKNKLNEHDKLFIEMEVLRNFLGFLNRAYVARSTEQKYSR